MFHFRSENNMPRRRSPSKEELLLACSPDPTFNTANKYILVIIARDSIKHNFYKPSGFAHLRFSSFPVLGHLISCQETGSIVAPILQKMS